MKKIILFVFCLCSLNLLAQNKVSKVILERTSKIGKFPIYQIEISDLGNLKYNGKRNVKVIGDFNFNVSVENIKNLFYYINSQKLNTLPNSYKLRTVDLPSTNLSFVYNNEKKKTINNISEGPIYLTQIAAEIDKIWDETVRKEKDYNIDGPLISDRKKNPSVAEDVGLSKPMPQIEIFEFVEQMPEYPGGDDKLEHYFKENLNYPSKEKEMGIEGRVICGFIVNEDGSLSDIKIVRSISEGCDEEAIRLIKNMPNWKPGKQNGKAVKVSYSLPIIFNLD
jgi:TonB family protein